MVGCKVMYARRGSGFRLNVSLYSVGKVVRVERGRNGIIVEFENGKTDRFSKYELDIIG